ncbi:MAG: ABC transporter permease [Chloroflexota bacterium]|nr:ABC transporter permease [Chloroflexota bacterium]MDE2853230.1 ABC transporter permease [Chloroflexota bacterium]MDE2948832.1 ABC transporter permease [Chloroflexota bacterium]
MLRRFDIRRAKPKEQSAQLDESYYLASQWQLIWRKFRRHRLAMFSALAIILLYSIALFPEFYSINDHHQRHVKYAKAPPHTIYFIDEAGNFHLRPFIYDMTQKLDMETLKRNYSEDRTKRYPIRFFVEGLPYRLLGLIDTNIHLIGVDEPGVFFPFGTDELGRDLFSRTMHAAQISLSIGFLGMVTSFVLGCLIGGVSGYFGGSVDLVVQRVIEFLVSIPHIPLIMALSAAFPPEWSSTEVYFGITVVLAVVSWPPLARAVRGKLLELREADFVMAARISNMGDMEIIIKHLLPSFASFLIVVLSLAVPGMILAETALSFLQIGIRPPAVSWGVLLQDAQNIRSLSQSPWLLIPGLFVIVTVLAFNFLGDGLRDAADPYKQ